MVFLKELLERIKGFSKKGFFEVFSCGCAKIPYGLKTSTEETKNKYTGFPTIYGQKSKLTMLEIWGVILNGSL
jgi:hypothetical protein